MSARKKITSTEFRRRVEALGIRSRAVLAAHNVIVDGQTINGQARECGVDPSYLMRLVRRIRRTEVCECCGQAIRPPSE